MLVLSRRQDEKIVFPGFGTTVTVVRLANGSVKLGIDAPDEVVVLREELSVPATPQGELLTSTAKERLAIKEAGDLRNTISDVRRTLTNIHNRIAAGGNPREMLATLEKLQTSLSPKSARVTCVA